MSVKLNHYWTIIPEKHDEYIKFITGQFIPGINSLGLHTVAAWSVLIGAYSEIVLENASNDLEVIEKALRHKKFKSLKRELFKYVRAYKTKVLSNTGKVDSYTMDVRKDTVKFNQVWDIKSQKKTEYDEFVGHEYLSILADAGVSVAGEWEILIGDGPGVLLEGRVSDTNNLIRNLQHKNFKRAQARLKKLVENYRSRLLTFHIQKIKGYKSESYTEVMG